MLRNGNKYLLMLVSIIMLTACISQSRTSFIPPQDRKSLLAEQPWPHNGFVAISWHNVEDEAADGGPYSRPLEGLKNWEDAGIKTLVAVIKSQHYSFFR